MTKNEFAYWKENSDKILSAFQVIVRFNKPIVVNTFKYPNVNKLNPDVEYITEKTSIYSVLIDGNKNLKVEFEDDTIIFKEKIVYIYFDKTNRKIEKHLIGNDIINIFSRKSIKVFEVRQPWMK